MKTLHYALYALAMASCVLCSCAQKPAGEWTLAWEENFEGPAIDETSWARIGQGSSDWNDMMSLRSDLAYIEDGQLVLLGKKADEGDATPYVTGGVWSLKKRAFRGCRIEIRAKFNSAQGFWPALWLMPDIPTKAPAYAEVDIMEHTNLDDFVYQTVHSRYTLDGGDQPPKSATCNVDKDDWNIYAAEIHKDSVCLFTNGVKTLTYPRLEGVDQQFPWPDYPFFIILSNQLGGQWVGEIDLPDQTESELRVDWIKVYEKSIPDPLMTDGGRRIKSAEQWNASRREEIKEIFASEMYGNIPAAPEGLHFKTLAENYVYDSLAVRKDVRIFLDSAGEHWFDIMLTLPAGADGPVPVFTGLNFLSNPGTLDNRSGHRWPYEQILESGWGVVTAWRDAIEPDGYQCPITDTDEVCRDGGVRAWYNQGGDWGAISAWAWGLSRIMDYLEMEAAVDASRVVVMGHSRLGKTALWAAANDQRFAGVISNESGCCGAAISRRRMGETFKVINTKFPYWFSRNFDKYADKEAEFPAEQHWLLALAAPRPLYVASAAEDLWSDPQGEWLAAKAVGEVYGLFGLKGISADCFPEPESVDNAGMVAYHIRNGKHEVTAWDWQQYTEYFSRVLPE